ncbi:MAG: hypothetical protein LUB59_00170 [Candidatus Gastranaerophilales bacterium]|nr:hypothetical protein [Candidatus Gastranaerophilales bacterium]
MIEKFAIFCKNLLDWFKSDRCFVKYFIDAFFMTNNNIILLTLILLFVFTVSMYIGFSNNNLLTLLVVILIMSALASGFFYSMKKSIQLQYNRKPDEKEDTALTFGTFYTGVGKYYLSFAGIIALFFILSSMVIIATFFAGNIIICDITRIGIDMRDFFVVLASGTASLETFLSGLDRTQQIYLRDWNRLFFITTQLLTYLIMFWIPEKMYTKKNVFVSLFGSVKKIILDIPNTLCIYLTIFLLNYIITIFALLFANSRVISFILVIFTFYLIVYDFYAIFLYYKTKYIEPYER